MHRRFTFPLVATLTLAAPAAAVAAQGTPSLTITAPTRGEVITSQNIPVTVSVKNFRLEAADIGMPARAGQGHMHVMVDGMTMAHLTNVVPADHATILGAGLKPGMHTIYVMLVHDDHTPASKPAMVRFRYEPKHAAPLTQAKSHGTPSFTILSPRNGERVGRHFNLRVALKNFTLSCDEGKANVPGTGHLHVFVHQTGVTGTRKSSPEQGLIDMPCKDTIPIDLSAWKKGKATLTVMLAQNDHRPVAASPKSVTINLK